MKTFLDSDDALPDKTSTNVFDRFSLRGHTALVTGASSGPVGILHGPLLLLASDAGRYITGTLVTADGGHLLSTL